jgi:hypothetical protein
MRLSVFLAEAGSCAPSPTPDKEASALGKARVTEAMESGLD